MPANKIIRDPVHGFIHLSPWELDIVNHRVFQRLRRIKQLALTEMVYPGACHTRFEHSLGVMHVATQMFDQLRDEVKDLTEPRFTKDDLDRARVIVRLTALLHDVGHCPFSHAGEEVMPFRPNGKKRYKHEDYSLGLIQHCMTDVIDHHPANQFGVKAADIRSFYAREGTPVQLLFWRPLVDGQMDADRADYLLRDSLHTGVAYGRYDLPRFVATLRVVRNSAGDLMIGIGNSGIQAAEGLILARYMMFTQVYFHKTRRAYDRHVTRTLSHLLKKQDGTELGQAGTFPPPDSDVNLERYFRWNDSFVWQAIDSDEAGEDGELIKTRQHDRLVHETTSTPHAKEHDHLRESIIPKLEGLDFWIDKADSSWYKFDSSVDIRVADSDSGIDANPVPLSTRSSLVTALKEITQRRVYVPRKWKEKAKMALAI